MVKSLIDVAENVKATDKQRFQARFSGSKGPSLLLIMHEVFLNLFCAIYDIFGKCRRIF